MGWIWEIFGRGRRLKEAEGTVEQLRRRLDVLDSRTERLEGLRGYNGATEVDALARKVNVLSNYGRTLELTSAKAKENRDRIVFLEGAVYALRAVVLGDITPAELATNDPETIKRQRGSR